MYESENAVAQIMTPAAGAKSAPKPRLRIALKELQEQSRLIHIEVAIQQLGND
jgi:hypothetical protein